MAAGTTLLSWNVLNRNPDGSRIAGLIGRQAPAIAALQEVVPAHLPAIGALGCHMVQAVDYLDAGQETFLVILARAPILEVARFDRNPGRHLSDSWYGRRMRWSECIQAIAATVMIGATPTVIVNLHLSAAVGPTARLAELEAILAWLGPRSPAIICGDFNSFGRAATGWLFGWPLNFAPRDFIAHEGRLLRRRMAASGFETAAEAPVTFPRLRLQMDHIFWRGLPADGFAAVMDPAGSDHLPLRCTFGAP